MDRLNVSAKKQEHLVWGFLGALGLLSALILALSQGANANLDPVHTQTFVEIDGQNYGNFSQIKDLKDITTDLNSGRHDSEGFTRVALKRDFVTEPSLYLWARRTFESSDGLKDVSLTMKTPEGQEISRYLLKLCKPLSWTVEAADPDMGGFHERIELAVQEIVIR